MTSRSVLALALLGALAATGCMKQDEAAVAASTPPADDTAMAADSMAADSMAGDSMAADSMAGDSMAADAMAANLPPARYLVTFSSRWTAKDHPLEYPGPKYAGLSVAHFSGLIGASHKPGYALFAEGGAPTPGLERLSEEGKHDPLDAEIAAAIASGQALAKVESTDPLKDHSKTETAEVAVDGAHPDVSIVAMIAPSPDWFAGLKDVNLVENGQWVGEKTVDLLPYDSGGDDGTTYRADDADTSPKKPIASLAGDPHFTIDGKLLPVASVTFHKL
jgi:pentapeptide MXKDX repeat protein